MSNATELAQLVLDWWEEVHYDYRPAPDFVAKAREIMAEVDLRHPTSEGVYSVEEMDKWRSGLGYFFELPKTPETL